MPPLPAVVAVTEAGEALTMSGVGAAAMGSVGDDSDEYARLWRGLGAVGWLAIAAERGAKPLW